MDERESERRLLNLLIYDYMKGRNFHRSAEYFAREVDVGPEPIGPNLRSQLTRTLRSSNSSSSSDPLDEVCNKRQLSVTRDDNISIDSRRSTITELTPLEEPADTASSRRLADTEHEMKEMVLGKDSS